MAYDIVRLHDEIRVESLQMLSDAFGTGKDFTKLFPRLFNAGTKERGQHFVALREGVPCGFLSNVELDYRVGKTLLKLSASGNVAVKKTERNQGLMGQLFETVDAIQRDDGIDLVMLHGARVRYRYFEFELGGIEYRFNFTKADLSKCFPEPEQYEFINLLEQMDLIPRAAEINNSQLIHIERDPAQFHLVLTAQMREAIGVLKNGELIGSMGYKENEIDHFSFTSYENFAEILYGLMCHKGISELNIGIPDGDKELMKNCMDYCGGYMVTNPANFKILNFAKVVQAFLQLKADQGSLCDGELTLDSDLFGAYRLTLRGGVATVEPFAGEAKYHFVGYEVYDFLFNVTPNRYGDYDPVAASWLPLALHAPYMA